MTSDSLRLATDANALVAGLSGEIDLSNAEELGDQIADATPADSLGVVLDLTDVSYIDSFGIYVIFGLVERLARQQQALVLVVPHSSPVQRTLQMANVIERLRTAEAVDDALGTLATDNSGV